MAAQTLKTKKKTDNSDKRCTIRSHIRYFSVDCYKARNIQRVLISKFGLLFLDISPDPVH